MRRRICYLFVAAILPLMLFLSAHVSHALVLDVPEISQEQSQWCWAGCSEATIHYYRCGENVPAQCDMANFARINNGWGADDCCVNPSGAICNQPNWMYSTAGSFRAILQNWGVNNVGRDYALSQATVTSEINALRPFEIRWGWASDGGHFLVGRGIDGSLVSYMDPWPGNGYATADYSWVVSGGTHTWTHSLQITTDIPDPVCEVDPTSLDFGTVTVGDFVEMTFSISNTGGGTLSGTVSEACDHYSLVGDASYSLGCGESKDFTARFEPLLVGVINCTIETGDEVCVDVICTGEGEPIFVELDIKPQSCPNPLSTKSKGVLPVAILGTEDFDVSTVDPATVSLEGVAPLRDSIQDVSRPVDPREDVCDCTADTGDGHLDMTLKFDNQSIVAALGSVSDGDRRVLTLHGATHDGLPIEGQDCVVIIKKGRPNLSVQTPAGFSLGDNHPNPFNPETEISFSLPERTQVSLIVYNILGEKVDILVSEEMNAGAHTVRWSGTDEAGNSVASGIYFYRLTAENFGQTKRMILLK